MQRTIRAGAILAILCSVSLLACGGGSDDAESTTAGDDAAAPSTAPEGDFLDQVNALCTDLNAHFADDVNAALDDTREVASAVQTTDPAALEPVFAAAEEGFAQAVGLVEDVRDEFTALDAPPDAEATISEVEDALETAAQMLRDAQQAAADEDLARFGAAMGQLGDLNKAQLDAAAESLAALGATECRPAAG
jgi:hypothetical protein